MVNVVVLLFELALIMAAQKQASGPGSTAPDGTPGAGCASETVQLIVAGCKMP